MLIFANVFKFVQQKNHQTESVGIFERSTVFAVVVLMLIAVDYRCVPECYGKRRENEGMKKMHERPSHTTCSLPIRGQTERGYLKAAS